MASTIVISEASIEGTNTTYHVIVQEQPTIAMLDTGANISFISQISSIFASKAQIIKITHA